MIYFVYPSYVPNTAVYNRAIAYLKAIDKMQIKIIVVFFLPDDRFSRINYNFRFVTIEYTWDKYYLNQKYLKFFSYAYYLLRFRKNLRSGDKVYIYGANDILRFLENKKGVDVYLEITEHPEVHLSYSRLYKPTVKQHVELCRKTKGMFVISTGLRDYYIQQGVSANSIHIVNMIVDSTRFDGITKQQCDPYIAYCGTASNNKDGVDQLIKAFAIVSSKHPNYKLLIIGSTPSKGQRTGNYKLVEDLGIKKNVVFTGMISTREMPQVLKNAEILALDRPDNNQAKYGFPTKLGEYLLTGNVVVVTCVGDIPLYLRDGVSALISEPQNPQAFAEKLCWAIDHPEMARIIGEEGRRVAEISFNNLIETKKIINVITQKHQ